MKKVVTLALLIVAAAAIAASSAPGDAEMDQNSNDRIMYIYWSGHGTGAWQRFEIYYDRDTRTFEGKWWYDNTHCGWIEGKAVKDIDDAGVIGEGRFGGDYAGAWEGTFYFRGECFGKTWAKTDPPGDGEFYGM
jgi:hypothetical protein